MDDIDFDDDSGQRSTRRSTANRRRRDPVDEDNLDAVLDSVMASTNKPIPQPRKGSKNREDSLMESEVFKSTSVNRNNNSTKAAVSGWGDEDFDGQSKSRRRSTVDQGGFSKNDSLMDNPLSKSRTRNINQEFNNDDEIEIPEIPEMEEQVEQSEDIAFKVAEAPDVQVHQISTYKELDKEFFKEKAFQFLEGNIDVSLLHCGLNTEQQVSEEDDIVWDWNKLFTEVVSILSVNKDSEGNEKETSFGEDDSMKNRNDKSEELPFQQTSNRRGKEISY